MRADFSSKQCITHNRKYSNWADDSQRLSKWICYCFFPSLFKVGCQCLCPVLQPPILFYLMKLTKITSINVLKRVIRDSMFCSSQQTIAVWNKQICLLLCMKLSFISEHFRVSCKYKAMGAIALRGLYRREASLFGWKLSLLQLFLVKKITNISLERFRWSKIILIGEKKCMKNS